MKQAASLDESALDPEHINAQRIGMVLRKMHLRSFRKGGSKPRGWSISAPELARLAQSYCLPLPGRLEAAQNSAELK